jgi:hypothetical protein
MCTLSAPTNDDGREAARAPLASRSLAVVALGVAVWLHSLNWWYTGPIYLVVHLVLVGGLAAASRAFHRGATDGMGRAVNAAALALPLTGVRSPSIDAERVADTVRESLPILVVLTALVVIVLAVRWRSLAQLSARHAIATLAVVTTAPPVLLVGLRATGGVATLIAYPVVIAVFARAWSWLIGRPSPTANALRHVVPPLLLATVLLATIASAVAPSVDDLVESASIVHLGAVLVLVAAALRYARDPILLAPDQPKPDAGPYR